MVGKRWRRLSQKIDEPSTTVKSLSVCESNSVITLRPARVRERDFHEEIFAKCESNIGLLVTLRRMNTENSWKSRQVVLIHYYSKKTPFRSQFNKLKHWAFAKYEKADSAPIKRNGGHWSDCHSPSLATSPTNSFVQVFYLICKVVHPCTGVKP